MSFYCTKLTTVLVIQSSSKFTETYDAFIFFLPFEFRMCMLWNFTMLRFKVQQKIAVIEHYFQNQYLVITRNIQLFKGIMRSNCELNKSATESCFRIRAVKFLRVITMRRFLTIKRYKKNIYTIKTSMQFQSEYLILIYQNILIYF